MTKRREKQKEESEILRTQNSVVKLADGRMSNPQKQKEEKDILKTQNAVIFV